MIVMTVAFHMFNGLRIIALDCFNLAGHQKLLFGLAMSGCAAVLISASFLFVPQILSTSP
jgi:succinate dehydrogenase hydrophobic anchor subunit